MTAPIIQRMTVLGPGTLGLSLAQWGAECGLDVALVGRTLDHARRGLEIIRDRWEGSVAKGRLQPEAMALARTRLQVRAGLDEALPGTDFLVEALPESLELKAQAWGRLGRWATAETLWATASSGIPVSDLRRESRFPFPILGFHLFVPVHHRRILELVSETEPPPARVLDLAQRLQLQVARAPDQPGYLASRLALLQGLEAMRMVEQGQGCPLTIDNLMTAGYGHPCGPLELSDRVGLDLRLAIALDLFQRTQNPAFDPPGILRQKVAQGHLGRKSGQGFYTWTTGRRAE